MTDKGRTITETGGSAKSRTLGLRVPEQTPPAEGSIFLEPRTTSDWIAALPLANIGETARQVYTTLVDFNRCDLPVLVRAKVVEIFRPTVAYVCRNLRRHYMEMGFPLSQKAWKTIILSRELNNELATSYKTIVERMLAGDAERFDRKLLVIALHRAIHFLSQVYLQACLSYTAPPPLLWKEVNALFAFARQNKIHRVPVKMHNEEIVETSTIEDSYKALMLFATATPSRLRQVHLVAAFRKTLEWAPHARFLALNEDAPDKGALNVNLGVDEQPIHNALRMPTAGRHVVILDVRALIQKLQKEHDQIPPDGSRQAQLDHSQISRALLRQLIHSWHTPAERQFVRTQLRFALQVLCGLPAIHSHLMQEAPEEDAPNPSNGFSGLSLSLETDTYRASETNKGNLLGRVADSRSAKQHSPSDENGGMLFGRPPAVRTSIPFTNSPSGDWLDSSLTENEQSRAVELTTMNESAGGYCVRWTSDNRLPKVKVGDLIGISGGSGQPHYSLGMTRWLNCGSQTEVDVGLHIVSTHVQAVNAYPAAAEGKVPLRKKTDPIPSLLLDPPPRNTKDGKPSVVLGSTAHTLGTYLWIEEPGNRELHLIRLTRVIDSSGAFVRFGFDHIAQTNKDDPAKGSSRDEFESLWHSL